MRKLNIIVVFDETAENVLMCRRRKKPYIGKLNFIGGHIEDGEDSLAAAYRELWEETAIKQDDVELIHFMNLEYLMDKNRLEVYVGKLNKPVFVHGDENELIWTSTANEFGNLDKFAGDGNILHIMQMIEKQWSILF